MPINITALGIPADCVVKRSRICNIAGSLGWPAYARFGAWMVLSVLVYCCYSVHGADARQLALANMQRSRCMPRRFRVYG